MVTCEADYRAKASFPIEVNQQGFVAMKIIAKPTSSTDHKKIALTTN
jgi:hypothetical protein